MDSILDKHYSYLFKPVIKFITEMNELIDLDKKLMNFEIKPLLDVVGLVVATK
jgi:hypothetical protein